MNGSGKLLRLRPRQAQSLEVQDQVSAGLFGKELKWQIMCAWSCQPWLDQGATTKWRWETSETHYFAGSLVRHSSWIVLIPRNSMSVSLEKVVLGLCFMPCHDFGVLPRPILHGLQSGPGSGQEAAEAIKALAPRQVMVELCQKRYGQVLSSMMMGRLQLNYFWTSFY